MTFICPTVSWPLVTNGVELPTEYSDTSAVAA